MKEYCLFLDESLPSQNLNYFCLAGCIINKEKYITDIIPKVNNLKQTIFNKTDIILHETEIRDARNEYSILTNAETRKNFWDGIHSIFTDNEMFIIGVAVSIDIPNTRYKSRYTNSNYSIAMQVVLENYVHFLVNHDAKGSVIIESTNDTSDGRLATLFHLAQSNGTLFFGKSAFQKHLTTINFHIKQDNNIGLQLADFIPNPVNRKVSGINSKAYSLIDIIENKLYDGGMGLKDRFGLKIIE